MKIKQLSLFVENKTGSLNQVCQVLAKNNIDIRTLNLADTEQFGILRLLVHDWEQAKNILEAEGLIVRVTEVVAMPISNEVGALQKLLEVIDNNNLSIEYMYAFTSNNGKAVMVFRFEDIDQALACFSSENLQAIESVSLYL